MLTSANHETQAAFDRTYFSFVTLATLGDRAAVPGSEVARGVAIAEAVAGQLDLAVMIARLVSLDVFDER
jgi:Ion channel